MADIPYTGDDNVLHVVIMATSRPPPLNEACYKGDIEQVQDLLEVELMNAQAQILAQVNSVQYLIIGEVAWAHTGQMTTWKYRKTPYRKVNGGE
jgi:hypothetical protein